MDRSEDVRRQELSREEQGIRKLFREAHRDQAVPPPFEALWNRVRAEATAGHRPPLNLRPVFVGALLTALVTLGILWSLRAPDLPPGDPTAILAEAKWDRTWSGWEGPLDFLLDTPGRVYLESVPTLLTDEPTAAETVSELERSATDVL